jgi:transcriptional regulator with XRE-family HTH domain
VASEVSSNIAAQINTMREDRGWTQTELAERAGMAQARISLLEDPDYERASLTTLKRIASAFDVGLAVRFVPFSDNLAWSVPERGNHLSVSSYEADTMPVSGAGANMRVVRMVVHANPRERPKVIDVAPPPAAALSKFQVTVNDGLRRHA